MSLELQEIGEVTNAALSWQKHVSTKNLTKKEMLLPLKGRMLLGSEFQTVGAAKRNEPSATDLRLTKKF